MCRYLFRIAVAIIALASCTSKSTSAQQPITDTVRFLNPMPDRPSARPSVGQLSENCILLYVAQLGARQNGKEQRFDNLSAVRAYVVSEASALRKQKLYILTDGFIPFDSIAKVVYAVKNAGIANYRVIDLREFFKPPAPVEIQTPHSVNTTTSVDGAFLIDVSAGSISLSFRGKTVTVKDAESFDRFLVSNKPEIAGREIILRASTGQSYPFFKSLIDALRKNGFDKFKLVTVPPAPPATTD